MDVEWEIDGVLAVVGRMQRLPNDLRYKGLRFAMRKGANLVRDAAKVNAGRIDDPKSRENIAANIAVRFSSRTFKRTGDVAFRVGVMGTANPRNASRTEGLPGGATQHWRWVEFGSEHQRATPFLRPALSQNTSQATTEVANQLEKWLTRHMRKMERGSK